MRAGTRRAVLFILLAALSSCAAPQTSWLGTPESIAPGVDLYLVTDATLLEPPAPIAIRLLRVDLDRARLDAALSNERVVEAERVDAMAARANALAAINAGFFNVNNGEPTGLLKIDGELVSDSPLMRGILAIAETTSGRQQLHFDQASVRAHLKTTVEGREMMMPIDGVDTTRARGKLMLYTPKYHADTDTAARGVEWVISGTPPAVTAIRRDVGRTPIPPDGIVLSFGGLEPPEPLTWLEIGSPVAIGTTWKTASGTVAPVLHNAHDIVNGAGLLKRGGVTMTNWHTTENLSPSRFTDMRHPRTVIGVDRGGAVWMVVVDGRQPDYSAGMTFAELIRLCDRLELQDALNLDGGGSSTMVVKGQIVNRPSDAAGPRAVSDAIVVKSR